MSMQQLHYPCPPQIDALCHEAHFLQTEARSTLGRVFRAVSSVRLVRTLTS